MHFRLPSVAQKRCMLKLPIVSVLRDRRLARLVFYHRPPRNSLTLSIQKKTYFCQPFVFSCLSVNDAHKTGCINDFYLHLKSCRTIYFQKTKEKTGNGLQYERFLFHRGFFSERSLTVSTNKKSTFAKKMSISLVSRYFEQLHFCLNFLL